MIEGDKQALDVDGITSKSIDVYYMDFKYDRLADAGAHIKQRLVSTNVTSLKRGA